MSADLKEKIKHVLPVLTTMLIGCVVLAIKQMFPFGNNTIDYYDMAQQIAAFYYHVFDMLHGEKAFFFDWYTALGVNMAMSTSGCSNLSLFNLFFLFIPRDMLLSSLSLFNLLKMMCMTFTMYLYLHKTYRAPYFFEAVFSVGYGFCGFVLVLYITNQWMDIAILFPLIILFLQSLYREGKVTGYIVTLSLALINSYYISFMILIFIFLMTGLWILAELLFEKKEDRKQYSIVRLGCSTAAAIGISLFILIPQLLQTLASARFENENNGGIIGQYLSILKQVNGAYTTRWWSLLGLSFAAAVVLYGLFRYRKNKKRVFLVCGSILMMILELFLENVNLMWHFGSYIQYPIRNGFMIYFVVVANAAFFAGQLFWEKANYKRMTFRIIAGILFTVLLTATLVHIYQMNPGLPVRTVFHITSAIMAVMFIIYLFLLVWKGGKLRHYSICLITIELIFYAFILIGKPSFVTGYSEEPEQEGEYVRICNQLSEQLQLTPDFLNRIKNPDESLNANYGLVLRRATLSNWTHLISPQRKQGAGAWGYSYQFTRLLDAGGTAFSDALLGITDTISCVEQDSVLYEYTDTAEVVIDHLTGEQKVYNLYSNKYTLPWGLVMSGLPEHDMEKADMVSLQNAFYQELSNHSEKQEIAAWIKNGDEFDRTYIKQLDESDAESVHTEKMKVKITGEKLLYFSGCGGDREEMNTIIRVNGSAVIVPSIKETDNVLYPAHFNNNAVYLGAFSDEEVNIEIEMDLTDAEPYKTQLSILDLNMLASLCDAYRETQTSVRASNDSLSLTVNADYSGEYLLLPLAYDAGWSAKVNGKNSQIKEYAGLFTVILLEKGNNEIQMKYVPKGMKAGAIVSVLTILITVVILIRNRKRFENQYTSQLLLRTEAMLKPVYMVVWSVTMALIYVIPIVAGVIVIIL